MTIEYWLIAVRDHPYRPPPRQRLVLTCLALRVDPETGRGFASVRTLARDAGVGERTVKQATAWARRSGLLVTSKRGHRLADAPAGARRGTPRVG